MISEVRHRRGRRWSSAVLVATAVVVGTAGSATAIPAGPALSGRTTFSTGVPVVSGNSGKCLSLRGSSAADSTPIVQFPCRGLVAQRWRAVPQLTGGYQVVSDTSGKCLNVSGNSTADGAAVIEYPCRGTSNERWQVRPVRPASSVQLVSERSGKCLDMTYGSTADNAAVIQYTCSGSVSQQWKYPPATAGGAYGVEPEYAPAVALLQGTAGFGLDYAFTDEHGQLVHGSQDSPAAPVTWTALSDQQESFGSPVLVPRANGVIQLHAEGIGGDVSFWPNVGVPDTAYDVGGASMTPPTVGIQPDGTEIEFVVDHNGALWQQPMDGTIPFLGWRGLPGAALPAGIAGAFQATPTPITVRGGIRLFGRAFDGGLWTALYSTGGTLSAWTSLGGTDTHDGHVAAVALRDGTVLALARNSHGLVDTTTVSPTGTPSGSWTAIGTQTTLGSPSAVISPIDGRVEVVARGTGPGSAIWSTGETAAGAGTWRDWEQVTADDETPLTDPTAAAFDDGTSTWGFVFRTTTDELDLYEVQPPAAAAARATATVPAFRTHVLKAPK